MIATYPFTYHQGVIAMAIEDKTLLTEDEIRAEVADLEGWEYLEDTKELQRVWHFGEICANHGFCTQADGDYG